jgi:hypothetical protein
MRHYRRNGKSRGGYGFGIFFSIQTIYYVNIILEVAELLFEIGSSIAMAGIAGFAYFKQNGPATNDAAKMQKIFGNAGWSGKEGEGIRLQRKRRIEGGVEYVYQLPLGFDRKKIESNKHILEDGLNVRHKFLEFDKSELLRLRFDKTIIKQIKKILTSEKISRKEIELNFDGMLRIKVYHEAMKDKIYWSDTMARPGSLAVPIGATRGGLVYHDFDKRKHLIIAGVPGSGKSAIIKLIITVLTMQRPEDVTFSLIDLKEGAAFKRFEDMRQTINFGTNAEEAMEIFKDVQEKMNDAYKKIVADGFEDVTEAKTPRRHFLIIDEAADLVDNGKAMAVLTDIVRKGRGAGYYVIYATQYPSAQAIPMQIKRNIPARLSFVLDSGTASTTVLDTTGAEDLPDIPGRGIYKDTKTTIIQAPYIKNKEIKERIEPHIVIRAKKEEPANAKPSNEKSKGTKHPIKFEKI